MFIFSVGFVLGNSTIAASTWTQYRGSNHDAYYTAPIRTNWTGETPRVLWRKPMPNGLSSFSVANDRLFTMGWRRHLNQDREFCIALNADTGAELWAIPIDIADYPNGGVGSDDGPRSTPTVDGDRVYAFSSYMNLFCFNAATGETIWSHNLIAAFGAQIIPWQNAASPTLVGELVFVNSNGRAGEHLVAFNKQSGAVAWKTGSYGMTHATPVRANIGGIEQIVFLAQSALVSVNATNGAVLWSFPLRYNGTSVAASPVVVGNTVYISRAYPCSTTNPQAGALVLQIAYANGTFTATRKWEKVNQLLNHWATPVHIDGHYYGVFGQSTLTLRCVDAEDGDNPWQVSGVGYGSVTRVENLLLVLSDRGDLTLVEPNPTAYREIDRIRPVTGKCWNNPAVSDGRIYIRSTTEAVALDVSLPNTSLPALQVAIAQPTAGTFRLEISTEDSSPIDPSRASSIEVFSRANLSPGTSWVRVTNSTVLSGGKLTLDPGPAQAQLFFRTEEAP